MKEITTEFIKTKVCEYYDIPERLFFVYTRKHEIIMCVYMTIYLSRKYTKTSSHKIGYICGYRDHSTVLYAAKTIQNIIDTDKLINKQFNEIKDSLRLLKPVKLAELFLKIKQITKIGFFKRIMKSIDINLSYDLDQDTKELLNLKTR